MKQRMPLTHTHTHTATERYSITKDVRVKVADSTTARTVFSLTTPV